MIGKGELKIALCLCWLVFGCTSANGQLARSFYNITGITAKQLPNAVQITIQTDGAATFGGNEDELFDFNRQEQIFRTRTTDTIRIRFVGARSKVPAFVNLGLYPVDSALVTLGNDPFVRFTNQRIRGFSPDEPRIDVTLRFYTPLTLQNFVYNTNGAGPEFSDVLQPRDVGIRPSPDGSAVIITILTDRAEEARAAPRIRRSPPESQNHRLRIVPVAVAAPTTPTRLRIDALHTPLADVARLVTEQTGVPLLVQEDAAALDVSLYLPDASLADLLQALATGYALSATERPAEIGGGYLLGRDGLPSENAVIRLQNLSPQNARLLFPDFLLRSLRADPELNALVVSGPASLIEKVRRDVATLDKPRLMVRVRAEAYEVSQFDNLFVGLRAAFRENQAVLDTAQGTLAVKLAPGQRFAISATLNALRDKGLAKLAADGFVTVASGAKGTLFLGQTRFVVVLQGSGFGETQRARALRLPIGTTLTVTPQVADADGGGEINLDLSPRFSTLDAVEDGTGLPTVGIRTLTASVRLRAGEAVLISALESDIEDNRTRIGSVSKNKNRTGFVLLIRATTEPFAKPVAATKTTAPETAKI